MQLDAAAVNAGNVVGQGAVLDGQRDTVGEKAAAGPAARVAVDLGVGDRRDEIVRLDAAAVADGGVIEEITVEHDQRALGALVAEATSRQAGEVVGEGAVEDGDRAVAAIADAAADAIGRTQGAIPADDGTVYRQVGTLERVAYLDGVQPDAGALVEGRVAGDDGAGIDEDPARTV